MSERHENQGNQEHTSPFDAIRQADEEGNEYWSARDLSKLLGYILWQKFCNVVEKAEKACENSGHAASDHFIHTDKMISAGKGAKRRIKDIYLSRYGAYLVVQNADPEKPIVALGQTYFAAQVNSSKKACCSPVSAQVVAWVRFQGPEGPEPGWQVAPSPGAQLEKEPPRVSAPGVILLRPPVKA